MGSNINTELLHGFWQRSRDNSMANDIAGWNEQVQHLSMHGIGMEESLQYLYGSQPSFEDFTGWVAQRSKVTTAIAYDGNVLSAEDMEFWNENGYIVVKEAVSEAACEAARNAIWKYIGASPNEPDSWYKRHSDQKGLMLSFFDHPALNANRTAPRIKKAYSELYNGADIYMLVDKVSFNPPENNNFSFLGSPLHWDVSLQTPIPYELQGLLYLTDVTETDGAFHCVPGFHNKIEEWLGSLPEGTNPRAKAIDELRPIPVPGKAGDLVIWHQALPHCATPNKGKSPRLVQYIAYKPVQSTIQTEWI